MSGYDWSRFLGAENEDLRPIVKWDEEGKVVKGTVAAVRDHEDKKFGKGTHPVIDLDGDSPCTLFVSQVDLQRKLAERNPQVGDTVAIRFDGAEKLENGNTVNRYSVNVTKPATEDDGSEPF